MMRILLIFIFGGTFNSLYASPKTLNIGVLFWSMNIEGQVAMRKGVEQVAQKINKNANKKNLPKVKLISYVAGDGKEGIENQIKQMKQLITKKPDAIIIQPTDNAALTQLLLKANTEKIPVVAYDQFIFGGKLDSYITSNNYQAGHLGGEYIDNLYPNDYEIKLIIVEYPNVSSTVERVDGFFDALVQNNQKYKILKTYSAVEPVSGRKAGKNILKDFGKKNSVDVVFTVNDGGGLSVVDELLKANRAEIKIATVDGDPRSIKNIKRGKLTVIDSAQFCAELGQKSMEITYNLLNGKQVPKKILVPVFPVTKETLSLYPGWLGQVPKPFKKPWNGKMWDSRFKEK